MGPVEGLPGGATLIQARRVLLPVLRGLDWMEGRRSLLPGVVRSRRREPRFIVDAMLGKLVTWLRLLGYDTVYAKDWPDGRILETAAAESRILVTRDHGLYVRARRRGRPKK